MTELNTGWKYRCLIRMHADIPSRSNEYWLFRDTGSGYAPLNGIDGRLEPYLEWTERLFGTIEVYKKTVFISDRAAEFFTVLSSEWEDRSGLFRALCGIGRLEEYSKAAKKRSDAVSRDIREVEARHSTLMGAEERCAFTL